MDLKKTATLKSGRGGKRNNERNFPPSFLESPRDAPLSKTKCQEKSQGTETIVHPRGKEKCSQTSKRIFSLRLFKYKWQRCRQNQTTLSFFLLQLMEPWTWHGHEKTIAKIKTLEFFFHKTILHRLMAQCHKFPLACSLNVATYMWKSCQLLAPPASSHTFVIVFFFIITSQSLEIDLKTGRCRMPCCVFNNLYETHAYLNNQHKLYVTVLDCVREPSFILNDTLNWPILSKSGSHLAARSSSTACQVWLAHSLDYFCSISRNGNCSDFLWVSCLA